MTRDEINQARKALADRTDRTEVIGSDTEGGLSLTAHWIDGGQSMFHTLDEVATHLEDHGDPGGAEGLRAGAFA